ncbi:50S ribosomal protein L14e [Candidatus Woesearchaeota archaeon]|nr:50S ribosomal protein L14e [Candidatus Woesearchaeota archaeon]
MSIFDVGRMCVKIAGRDAGRKCVVVENLDAPFVVVDGDVRRRKVNTKHLEPLEITVDLKGKTSHADVKAAFSKLGQAVWETKAKKPAARLVHLKKKREAPVEAKKAVKKKTVKAAEETVNPEA